MVIDVTHRFYFQKCESRTKIYFTRFQLVIVFAENFNEFGLQHNGNENANFIMTIKFFVEG